MTVIKLLKLVRSGRGELCYSPPFVTRLLFVKGAWSHEAESTGQLAALKTVSDEGMTNLGKQKMGAGSVMWECSCDHLGDALNYPTFEPLFVPFSVYSLAVFSPPWADRVGPCLAQSRLVAHVWNGNLKRLQTNNVWWLKNCYRWPSKTISVILVALQKHSEVTESQNSVSWKGSRRIKSNPYVNGPYRDQTHVCRSGLATGLPCSFTQHIFLLPPNKGGGSWWQLRCFGAAVVLLGLWCCSSPLGSMLLPSHFVMRVRVPNAGWSASPQDFTLKVTL